VDDWVQDQTTILWEKTTCQSDPITKGDENLWLDLISAF
jgi:hypothetical protein